MSSRLESYRKSDSERARTADLLSLIPEQPTGTALDVGARDGWFSLLLAERFQRVTALDLVLPEIDDPRVDCVVGDALQLEFPDNTFDLVFCTEVLEHIRPEQLSQVTSELQRVCRRYLIIGVPYRQDLRVGRTTCHACGKPNPPWGHVNSFDERRLVELFGQSRLERTSLVGHNDNCTNFLASWLLDRVGNPYGTYRQQEPCTNCGVPLRQPSPLPWRKKVITHLALWTIRLQSLGHRGHPNWIHLLLQKLD